MPFPFTVVAPAVDLACLKTKFGDILMATSGSVNRHHEGVRLPHHQRGKWGYSEHD